jgi:hypothetical protein
MNVRMLSDELTNDPLARGYGAMTDAQARDSLNTVDRTKNKDLLAGDEMFSATDSGEWAALTDHKQSLWMDLCGRESINPFGAANLALVTSIFGAGPTLNALAALRVEDVSRAGELGGGLVSVAHVSFARRGSYEEQ